MPKEDNFTKERDQLLASLMIQAKKKGFMNYSTIMNRFSKFKLTDEDKEELVSLFISEGISIIYTEDKPPGGDVIDPEFDTDDFQITEAERKDVGENFGDSIKTYLKEIHDFPALTHKETLMLIRLSHEGNKQAREKIIHCNLKLAFIIAVKYVGTSIPLPDLIQQANLGLMNAIDHFNPGRGTKFSTYAVFWIKQSILHYLRDHSRLIRLPHNISADLFRIKAIEEDYYAENNRYPTDDEIATAMGISIARVKNLKASEYAVVSADEALYDDTDQTILDVHNIEDETQDPYSSIRDSDLHKALTGFLDQLKENERKVIQMRFGIIDGKPKTLEEIGAEMGCTRESIRQTENRALNHLRKLKGITSLYDYLT